MQPVEREIDGGFLFGRKVGWRLFRISDSRTDCLIRWGRIQAKHSTDGKAGARMSYTAVDELQSVRDSYPCPGSAIRATRTILGRCHGAPRVGCPGQLAANVNLSPDKPGASRNQTRKGTGE